MLAILAFIAKGTVENDVECLGSFSIRERDEQRTVILGADAGLVRGKSEENAQREKRSEKMRKGHLCIG